MLWTRAPWLPFPNDLGGRLVFWNMSVGGTRAPMYACGPCIRILQDQVWQCILLSDGSARSAQVEVAPEAEPSGGHRGGGHRARGGFLRRH